MDAFLYVRNSNWLLQGNVIHIVNTFKSFTHIRMQPFKFSIFNWLLHTYVSEF